jgi:hypothetical protein
LNGKVGLMVGADLGLAGSRFRVRESRRISPWRQEDAPTHELHVVDQEEARRVAEKATGGEGEHEEALNKRAERSEGRLTFNADILHSQAT